MTEGNEGNLNNQGTGDQGSNNQNASAVERPAWSAQLPDTLKENQSLLQFKTIGELGNKFIETDGKLKNAIFMPGEKATPEERATFNKQLGVPESPDKYQFDKLEAPEWFEHDEEGTQNFRKWAFENGLPQKATAKLYNQIMTARIAEEKELKDILVERQTRSENALKDLWKTDYAANKELAIRGLENGAKSILGEERGTKFAQFLKDSHLADDPFFLQFFHGIGKAMDSDKTAFGTGFTSQGGTGNQFTKTDKAGNPMLDFKNTPSMRGS